MADDVMWRPLEPGETHGFQLKARSWGDRLKIAYILLTALRTLLWRGEASLRVTRGRVVEIKLVQTCSACPEQYNALNEKGETVGYLRLRWGHFTVECPGPGDTLVYEADPEGDGIFDPDEREFYLEAAKSAIRLYYSTQGQQ